MLISAVQQSDSVIHMHTFFFIFFSIMVYHRIFNIVPCAVGPYCLSIFFFFLINLFIYLFIFGCVGSSLLHVGSSLVAASGGYSSLRCTGLSLWWLLLLRSTGALGVWASVAVACRLSSCGSWALEHRLSSCGAQT